MASVGRGPLVLLGLGVLSLLAGGSMVATAWHHTVGLGLAGLGVALVLIGGALSLTGRLSRSGRPEAGESLSAKGARRKRMLRLTAVVVVIAVVAFASLAYVVYVASLVRGGSQPTLSLRVDSSTEVAYPNGTVAVRLAVVAAGGTPPYSFSAQWEDSLVQTSAAGNFTRDFRPGETIVSAVYITARSESKALGSLYLTLPSQTLSLFPGGGPVTVVTASGSASTSASSTTSSVQNSSSVSTTTYSNATSIISSATTSTFSVKTGLPSVTTSQPNSFTITVDVLGTNHQPLSGATVSFDGANSQVTGAGGNVVFQGVASGSHTVTVVLGSFDESFPLILPSNSYASQTMFVTVQ